MQIIGTIDAKDLVALMRLPLVDDACSSSPRTRRTQLTLEALKLGKFLSLLRVATVSEIRQDTTHIYAIAPVLITHISVGFTSECGSCLICCDTVSREYVQ